MKGKLRKRFAMFGAVILTFAFTFPGLSQLFNNIPHTIAHAIEGNEVYFEKTSVEASNTNIVYANLIAYGTPGETVSVNYKTYSGTAIRGIDFSEIENTVSLKIKGDHYAKYEIAIKCLNDTSTREKLRLYSGDTMFGRYFNLKIVSASNATPRENANVCKCYLTYNNKVEATVGQTGLLGGEVAYINDYKTMLAKYDGGTGGLDGGSTRRSWEHGISFNNETTQRWISTYINPGFANAYGTLLIKTIDDGTWSNDGSVSIAAGNKQFISNYKRESNQPGMYLYCKIDPPGERLNGKAMNYLTQKINPYDKDDDLVDAKKIYTVSPNSQHIYWIQDSNAWFASKGSVYDSGFFRVDPYNGVLDQGFGAYNHNSEADMKVKDIWMLMTLYDSSAPVITGHYVDYYPEGDEGKGTVRLYLRFNEPVYAASKNSEMSVRFNGYDTALKGRYLEGNYSDTLVYEVKSETGKPIPSENITQVKYELPKDMNKNCVIGDMSYKLDAYKNVGNNRVTDASAQRQASIIGGVIDLSKPKLSASPTKSTNPQNFYNILLSANNNGTSDFKNGTIYYTWSTSESIDDPELPSSYTYSHVLTPEDNGSFNVSLTKNEAAGITSGSYYLHALAVSTYGFKDHDYFGPYTLDGDAPSIGGLTFTENSLKTKIYNLEVGNKAVGTLFKNVTLNATYTNDLGLEVVKELPLVINGSKNSELGNRVNIETTDEHTVFQYKSNIDPARVAEIENDTFITELMGTDNRISLSVTFTVEDQAGNHSISNPQKVVYDTRELFTVDTAFPATYIEDSSIILSHKVYNTATASESDGITFSISDPGLQDDITNGAKFSLIINDDEVVEGEGYSIELKNLPAGHYDIVARVAGHTIGGDVDTISNTVSFYLTKDLKDKTTNKETADGNLVLSNRVFQLQDARFYFYNSKTSSVNSHYYGATYNESNERYDGGSSSPTFSSSVEAKKYLRYMEYQDLEVISITDTIASLLNSGTGSTIYVKASGETRVAQAGQLWVRYKKSSWTTNVGPAGWAFYYYGEGADESKININILSPNLSSAIETIINRIITTGVDKYLVEEDDLHQKTNAPFLAESQMHVMAETVSQTKCGDIYEFAPTYGGDAAIYQNNVTVNEKNYPLATNMVLHIDDNTSLYYKYLDADTWTPLQARDGMLLADALKGLASGVYHIREYDSDGACEFSVYFDKTIPVLNVTKDKGLDGQTELNLDGGDVTTLTCTNLVLNELTGEVDPYAYVAIYSYPNDVLQKVLYANNVKDYALEEGNYYLQVGDRSGNVVTYTVLTSASDIDLVVEENDAKTGVVVKVSNRTDSEIYSYEVYLNEQLLDTEFAESKFYRDSGIYRVTIVDIYGKRVERTITHEAATPDITWYYLNENDGYSLYDPNSTKPQRMVLVDDPTSSRTTDVYASTLVKMSFGSDYNNGNVKFEVIGLDVSDYSYNESTGLLSINSLASWRVRVWYENQPDNDRLYVFHLDNNAPEISASFIGTEFHNYVKTVKEHEGTDEEFDRVVYTSSFDAVDFDKYNDGDVITLDSLEYEINGTTSLTFDDGAIISGNHITITVDDPTGIRDYSITRNGQLLKMELDDKNQLVIHDFGNYELVFTDILGNTSTFKFTNLDGGLANSFVDGVIAEDSVAAYGHEDMMLTAYYDGSNSLLIKYTDKEGNEKSDAYLFNSDGKVVTFGQYYVKVGGYDEEGTEITGKHTVFVANDRFALAIDETETRFNVWYPAISNDYYNVQVMIDNNKHVNYRVTCNDTLIEVESRFSIGNTHLPNRYVTYLSHEIPTITLLTGGEVVEQKEELEYIYIADVLTIKQDAISANIKTIEFAYSETPEFGESKVIYENGEFKTIFAGHDDGFYKIDVTNIFNNKTTYLISKIVSFVSVVDIVTSDNKTITYYGNDGSVIFSNSKIILKVYSDTVKFMINGVESTGYMEKGITYLELTKIGAYEVEIVGDNGIKETFKFEIGSDDTFIFDEEWITGYNEEALLRDQGYTNSPCSISVDEEVVYIDMIVNDSLNIKLYDNISEEKLIDEEMLKEAIGKYGVGKYVVEFRNKYGDLTSKTVYFNNVPALYLDRIITSDPNSYEKYDLDFALTHDFYSNYVLRFSTDSIRYIFTINGLEYRLDEPKTIEFSNASGNGSFSYSVTYLDEYGNHLEFDAILSRVDLTPVVDISKMSTMTVSNELYTKDDIVINFGEGLKATVSIDNQAAVDYESGFTFYGDGRYAFVVRDIAGNRYFYTINHKSMNHYELISSLSNEPIIFGGVVNDANVTFSPSDDSKLVTVFKNGELMENYSTNLFSQTGHWEIIIEDAIGNRSYEEFYILNNSLRVFEYTAPFDYEVTEVWRIRPDGTREMTNFRGTSIKLEENGDYVVVVSSNKYIDSFNFTVSIDDTLPTAKLNGVENNSVTAKDVTISGLKNGDIVKIYKDGVLVSTTVVGLSGEAPAITTGGKYRVVITNIQGSVIEYNFVRKSIVNVAGSIFVMVTAGLLITGIALGLIYHTKLKTDR